MSLNSRPVGRGGHIASDSYSGGHRALGSIFMLDPALSHRSGFEERVFLKEIRGLGWSTLDGDPQLVPVSLQKL